MRLHDVLDYQAREHPDLDFAVQEGRRISYREARSETRRMARALLAAGASKGDRVAILSRNTIELALLYFACSRAGIVPVPLNYRLAPREWAGIAADAEACLLLAQGALARAVEPVRDAFGSLKRFFALDDAPPGWESFHEWVAGQPDGALQVQVAPQDVLYQMYTSGTTGRPKGAMLSHRAVMSQLHQVALAFGGSVGERSLIVAPLYHAAAAVLAFASVQMGGTLVIQEEFDPKAVVRALSEEDVAVALLVPVMIQFCLLAVPDAGARRYDSLRLIVYGASPIAEEPLRRAMEIFRCDFLQGYGMTETTAVATNLLPDDHRRALAGEPGLLLSAGRPLLGTEVGVVDAQDRPLPPGEIGEVVVRGPQLMSGYWNLPEASETALRGGWMHTGDAGTLDEQGYLYIQDRVKDMIVSGGENVYPREVEGVLFEHPAVADVAVIGVPDERWGEAVKALVVTRPGQQVSADEIIGFCEGRLGGFKRPRSVDFVDSLPRNPSGKVLKKDLRERYWSGRSRRVS